MPYHLIWKNLRRHWVRSVLTMGSIAIAVFLVIVLRTFVTSLTAQVDLGSSRRLVAQSAVSLFVGLPRSYEPKIETIPGVRYVSKWQWFGGRYGEGDVFFAQFGVDVDVLRKLYPELLVDDAQYEAFAKNRRGCIIGRALAEDLGLGAGDALNLQGTIFTQGNGRAPWEFVVSGIYDSGAPNIDERTMFFHFDYLAEALDGGEAEGPTADAGVYVIGLDDDANPEAVIRAIDERFADGDQAVRTTTEAEFNRQFLTMMGSVPTFLGGIGAGVLFAILFAAVNTMLMAGRERTRDLGVTKALGFRDRTAFGLLMGESLLLAGIGGGLGIAAALLLEGPIRNSSPVVASTYATQPASIVLALIVTIGVGLLAGALPAWRAGRLRTVDALRHGA